ncbi:hypothetical protein DRE_04660 [Drechslerella stenobrocha 248]|uniref:Sas10 C-terminal domain-containing protein n=1 Tax=Drechslerella stenobrocha 248 TaxID=1043628 RepID=W7HPN6_9PEZI|nr:hypothetical protein DRE_04660 [Drechslerella stenobrocha 248]
MTVAAPPPALSTLLGTLTTSLTSTAASLPDTPPTSAAGISLLDLKNDVFLSYLHHLSYLLLFRVRNGQLASDAGDSISSELVKTLASLRVWLEKGVKPCENKLKYQVEKVLKAASEWEREQARKLQKADGDDDSDDQDASDGEGEEDDDSDDEDVDDSDEEITSESETEGLPTTVNYDSDDLLPNKKRAPTAPAMKNALAYRPNPSALSKPSSAPQADSAKAKDGIYRPPKLNPVSMPTAPTAQTDPDAPTRTKRREKARAIDEFLDSMPGAAPTAEPSIGSNVGHRGHTHTARERAKERERREYEETNFVRLPGLTKKERGEKKRAGGREWGGEDWSGLERGMGLDRIERLTKKRGDGGVLERSRKRGADVGGEADIGARFEKRRRTADREQRRRAKR